ncbi:MAG: glutaredoxin 3 [Alphaproteobacteria bacterium]|jgi:glutaredoxin 3|nr:glutaredoxin 3 [Alphaproteobacteria bacterium]
MTKVIIYTTPQCYYCVKAKKLFDKLDVPYLLCDVSEDVDLRKEMLERSGGRTSVPQIFIGDAHIGGFDDLYALYKAGNLAKHLNH